jgi:hypothetical protein
MVGIGASTVQRNVLSRRRAVNAPTRGPEVYAEKRTRRRALSTADESDAGFAPGSRLNFRTRDVPHK